MDKTTKMRAKVAVIESTFSHLYALVGQLFKKLLLRCPIYTPQAMQASSAE